MLLLVAPRKEHLVDHWKHIGIVVDVVAVPPVVVTAT
jgi:hypothetical protein